ncbi:ATP-binding cassette domain-containing protein [Curtobacterium sp. MCJR17_020]|uniref:ATP-binding cassette domain-containing protein n=1 Tax=Curtobacterium sp. MCJR17_020 TaxID=2175619 RepID=UPI000DA7083B|nr:ATP-binding cassette domain-containing protein [Curtobacterium sp. MCJR17_020]WIE72147.1 ATP-binding cassette domain-containing protein [Curtobacterium sp. MCJR17_020]
MLIQANAVAIDINGKPVLTGEDVTCAPGTMTALVGPSGSGKTTLLHCLGLLLTPDSGSVMVDGTEMTHATSRRRRAFWRDHAAFILQDYGIMEDETVAFNVTMRMTKVPAGRRAASTLDAALAMTGLSGRHTEIASHLSGGEKQRLAMARAIHKRADVLFVDEPTASLDAANRALIIQLLADFAAAGSTVIVSTHDDDMISACTHHHRVGGIPAGALRPHTLKEAEIR